MGHCSPKPPPPTQASKDQPHKRNPGLAVWRPGWAAGSPPKVAHAVIYSPKKAKPQGQKVVSGCRGQGGDCGGQRGASGRSPSSAVPAHLCQSSSDCPRGTGALSVLANHYLKNRDPPYRRAGDGLPRPRPAERGLHRPH